MQKELLPKGEGLDPKMKTRRLTSTRADCTIPDSRPGSPGLRVPAENRRSGAGDDVCLLDGHFGQHLASLEDSEPAGTGVSGPKRENREFVPLERVM